MTNTPTPLAQPNPRYRWNEADTCPVHGDGLDTNGTCGSCRTERTYSGTAAPISSVGLERWARANAEADSDDQQ